MPLLIDVVADGSAERECHHVLPRRIAQAARYRDTHRASVIAKVFGGANCDHTRVSPGTRP